ncbi:MAG: tetratricopeptide repeat protein [Candidatus Hydrogenedentota bacterium]
MKKFVFILFVFVLFCNNLNAYRNEEALIEQIEKWINENNKEKAINKLREILEEKPVALKNRDVFLLLASKAENKISKSITYLNEIINNYPESHILAYANFELGMNYFYKEDYQNAITYFNNVLSLNKENDKFLLNEETLYRLGLCYIGIMDNTNAINVLNELEKKYTGGRFFKDGILSLADILYKNNDYDNARINYHRYLVLYPDSIWIPWVYLQLYRCDINLGKNKEAEGIKDFLIKNYTDSLEAYALKNEKIEYRIQNTEDRRQETGGKGTETQRHKGTKLNSKFKIQNSKLEDRRQKTEDRKEGEYIIQIGSFKEIIKAENLQNELKNKGIESYIETINVRNETYYRVRIGFFDSKEEANEFIIEKGLEGWIYKK